MSEVSAFLTQSSAAEREACTNKALHQWNTFCTRVRWGQILRHARANLIRYRLLTLKARALKE